MASVPDLAMRYPLWRRRRRSRWRWLPADRRRAGAIALLTAVLALVGVLLLRPAHVDPRLALAGAEAALTEHRWGAARDGALQAEGGARAQLVLARAYLELGDGVAAEAALSRAAGAGAAPGALHHLRAEARLLQGDEDGALAEAARADVPHAAEGVRVTALAWAAKGQPGRAQQLLLDLLARQPRLAAAWADLGRIRLRAGDVGGAAVAATRAVMLDRRDPAALVLEGEVVRTRLGLVAALPWFSAAARHDPAFHDAHVEEAATLGEMGRYRAMLAATRRALAARLGSPQALYLQAVLAARAGRVELARGLLGRTGGALGDLPGALLLGTALDLAAGTPELAVAKARQLIDAQPYNLAARRLLATALLRSGDVRGARDALTPLVARADADAYSLQLAALTGDLAMRNRALAGRAGPATAFGGDDAIGTLQARVAQNPADPTALLALIRGLAASGATADAITTAGRLVGASPGAPPAQLALGDALLLGGDARGASAAFARAANLRFDEPALLRLLDGLARQGRGAEAGSVLATFLSQNPDDLLALRLAGHWQLAARQWSAAGRSLERVRARVGNRDAALLADLAGAYAGQGRLSDARRYAAAAYRLAPGSLDVVRSYAAVLGAAGDRDGARQLAVKAEALAKPD